MISMVIQKILEFYRLVTLLKKTAYAGYTVSVISSYLLYITQYNTVNSLYS